MSPGATLSLSRRAVACPGWRWTELTPTFNTALGRRGVVVVSGHDALYVCEEPEWYGAEYSVEPGACCPCANELLPDMDRPLGWLLALVREALPQAYVEPDPSKDGFRVGLARRDALAGCVRGSHRRRIARVRSRGGATMTPKLS